MAEKLENQAENLGDKKSMQIESLTRLAQFSPSTFNAEKRTIDVVFTTGAKVRRFDWFSGSKFIEELSVKGANLERLNKGASVLNNHGQQSLNDVLGVVENARIQGNEGLATIRFSNRPEVQSIIKDIQDGIIRNISVGYQINKFEEQKPLEDGTRHFLATDWTPAEISFVTVPADSGAQVRNSDLKNHCELIFRNHNEEKIVMAVETKAPVTPAQPEVKIDLDAEKRGVETERKRVQEIKSACAAVELRDFADELIEKGTTIDEARKLILEKLAVKPETRTTNANAVVTRDENDSRMKGYFEALMHRADSVHNKLTDLGREFRGMSLCEMVRDCLEAGGVKTRGMNNEKLTRTMFDLKVRDGGGGLHSISDFPSLLENVLNKVLRDAYMAAPKVFQPITREVEIPDFKQRSVVSFGDAPELELVPEGGPIVSGTVSDTAEKYQLETYAKMVRVSRKALINDDLNAFVRLPQLFGVRAAEKESDLVWGVILSNAALADSIALFHASHSNLQSGALSDASSLSPLRQAMRKQKGLNGARINLTPTWLFVPPELETKAQQIIAPISATQVSNVNPFVGSIKIAVEPRLSDSVFNAGASTTAYFLTADIQQLDIVELARLSGEVGPVIESDSLFDVEGMKIKCRIDLAAKAIDYRGLQKSTGV
jgi:HK97 family phage prohead protease